MKVILTGGGSGGHITPILAVADELKRRHPEVSVIYIGQTNDKLADIPASHPNIDLVYRVRAGKLRRYYGHGWRHLLDAVLIFKNLRDIIWVMVGTWQSYKLLRRIKPNVIFIKGGFVGVPVGLAAAKRHIPYVTHDSDATAGLANRIIARWASAHTVAMPKLAYPYPKAKTHEVGVPVSEQFQPVTYRLQTEYRRGLGLASDDRVLCITGGGLGAQRLNEAVTKIIPELIKKYSSLNVFHIAGRTHEQAINEYYDSHIKHKKERSRIIVKGFVNDLYRYTAAADVIISRAGATHLAEFAVQKKACILVPNPILTGGHQLKNAEQLANTNAAIVVTEEQLEKDSKVLLTQVKQLFDHYQLRQSLADQIGKLAKPDAAQRLTDIILNVGHKSKPSISKQ